MLMKEEKFFRGCTHKAAQVSRIHAYVEDLEGQEA
jgi:tetrahydromethanopterin S-methyltransferase subunit F